MFVDTGGGATTINLGTAPDFRLYAATLDGDGRADLVAYNAATGQTLQGLSRTGGGFTVFASALPAGRQAIITDLDGDGRSDLVLYDAITGALTLAFTQANGSFRQEDAVGPPGVNILAQGGF